MPVNTNTWQSWPLAARETPFNADDAIARIQNWAGGSAKKFNQAFLFRIDGADPKNPASYRLPLADVSDGRLVLVPRAVFSAGVIMSGGHGGLYDVLDDTERDDIRSVLTRIYDKLSEEYSDPRVVAPWLRGNTKEERNDLRKDMGVEQVNASVRTQWDLPIAPLDTPWYGQQAKGRIWDWAEGEYARYSQGFLYADARGQNTKSAYRVPLADIVDGELMIVPRAVMAYSALLASGSPNLPVPASELPQVAAVVSALADRITGIEAGLYQESEEEEVEDEVFGETDDDEEDEEMTASAVAPVRPPREWFTEPPMARPEPLTVTADGRVSGLIARFGKCHMGIGDQCVMAPRSASGYQYFLNGQVLTADGSMVRVGKLTQNTGHARPGVGAGPAAAHYDNTGTGIAVVNIGENAYGIWVAGSVVPNATEEQVAELRRSPISGDWRRVGGHLELVAALAVNTPGFPIVASLEGSDEPDTILAAGVMLADGTVYASIEEASEPGKDDEDFQRRVDEIDEKISRVLAARRARTYDRISAAMDERRK